MHSPNASLALRLFGPFEALLNGTPLPRLRSRKGYWLLALLVLRHDREVERAWLAGTLWPESSEAHAFASLRDSLKDLRRALGLEAPRLYAPSPSTLCLKLVGAIVDVAAFDTAIDCGETSVLEAAVSVYRGPLLEGWTEEWVFQERHSREQSYLIALETLASHAMAGEQWAEAARYLRLAVGAEALRESAQRALMQALAADGNYAAATQTYRELRRLLHHELNAEPAPATSALFQQIRAEARQRATGDEPRGGAEARGREERAGRVPAQRVAAIRQDRPADSPPPAARVPGPLAPLAPSPRLPCVVPRQCRLPRPLTGFVGRKAEVEEAKAALAARRLVTLTGAGGVGKTRLAIQVAEELADEYADGVCFVDLTALVDPVLVPQAVTVALGVEKHRGHSLTEALVECLGSQQLLLVLDNCEHLVEACARLAESLLRACSDLKILATSRQSLGLTGEVVRRVPSLSVPDFGVQAGYPRSGWRCSGVQEGAGLPIPEYMNGRTLEHLMQYDAVRLFVERAWDAESTFVLTARNAPATVRICRQLDGIPLALELAAARVSILPAEQIAARLDDRFNLLTDGSRTAQPRHQTLQALIDWSYDLLPQPEQKLLQRLSVFAGGWTLEAAEAVCSDFGFWILDFGLGDEPSAIQNPKSKIQNPDVLDLLTSLVEKSLVLYEGAPPAGWSGGEGRYRLLETVRQYARDRLFETGEGAAVRERHLDWFLALAEQASEGESETAWLERLEREHDNLRAALAWSGAQGQIEAGLRLGVALGRFWFVRGYLGEGRERLAWLLALPGAEARTGARASVLRAAGLLAREQGDLGAVRALIEESRAIFQELGDQEGIAASHRVLGWVAHDQGEYGEAWARFEESLAICREVGDKQPIASSLIGLGFVAREQGDLGAARALIEESLAINRELGDKGGIAWSLTGLGWSACRQGDYGAARAFFGESLAIGRELDNKGAIAWSLTGLGWSARGQGDYGAARAFFEESLVIAREAGCKRRIVDPLEGLAALAVAQTQPERAARLFGVAEALREAIGTLLSPADRAEHDRSIAAIRTALGEAGTPEGAGNRSTGAPQAWGRSPGTPRGGFAAAWAKGRAMSLEDAMAYALVDTSPGEAE